ncbi:MAG: 50S ribosomal protein L29 [Candidatus Promineifilaceae bacterium]|jgi:large subunit ribosomal protein L29
MANIVEIREMSDDKLTQKIEDAREELFNLRFQKAFAQLDNHARLKKVRREIAQFESVLNMRKLAVDVAANEPAIAAVLEGEEWQSGAHFDYEESAWQVVFRSKDGQDLATAVVDLNKKRSRSREQREKKGQPQLVTSYDIVG